MQYLCNESSDFKNSWSCLILTLLWIWWYTTYPLHLNYKTILPCKTTTMKITIFIIVLVLKSNENIEIWQFSLSQLANSSKLCENILFEDVHFYLAKKVFLVVALKDNLNITPNLSNPAKTVLKISKNWLLLWLGCTSCPGVHLHIFPVN